MRIEQCTSVAAFLSHPSLDPSLSPSLPFSLPPSLSLSHKELAKEYLKGLKVCIEMIGGSFCFCSSHNVHVPVCISCYHGDQVTPTQLKAATLTPFSIALALSLIREYKFEDAVYLFTISTCTHVGVYTAVSCQQDCYCTPIMYTLTYTLTHVLLCIIIIHAANMSCTCCSLILSGLFSRGDGLL